MRRAFDRYATPARAVEALCHHWPTILLGDVLEPCAGRGDLVTALERLMYGRSEGRVITNDIDPAMECEHTSDATTDEAWAAFPPVPWVVSNPPYGEGALYIIERAIAHATVGVAMLLRLSWLEPTTEGAPTRISREEDVLLPGFERRPVRPMNPPRAAFWREHPAQGLIPTSRISFTGDGSTDSVTTGWIVWRKGLAPTIFPTVL